MAPLAITAKTVNKGKVIGIPQALGYYYFYPLWKTFFTQLGFTVKTSGMTDRQKLDSGIKIAPSETCLPLKCYLGHVVALLNHADRIFVPRLVCLKKKPKIKLGCPKFIGLPDMVRALLPEANILSLDIDFRIEGELTSYVKMAKNLECNSSKVKHAYQKAIYKLKQYGEENSKGNLSENNNEDKKIKIGLLGHRYLIEDKYLNLDFTKKLSDLDCRTVYCYDLSAESIDKELGSIKSVSWYFEEEILGAAKRFLHINDVSGVIYLLSFGCGAGSITSEIIDFEIRGKSTIPLLRVIIDEHTGETGLMTRLESFIDMIKLKKEQLI